MLIVARDDDQDDLAILWELDGDDPVVRYIGSDRFTSRLENRSANPRRRAFGPVDCVRVHRPVPLGSGSAHPGLGTLAAPDVGSELVLRVMAGDRPIPDTPSDLLYAIVPQSTG